MQEASGWSKHQTPNAATTISCKAWNSPAEYPSWVARCDIKGSVSTVLNPIFSKKVQGQKHPGRWGIVEHQIPSIKMLFKTNTKGHKHPSIRFLSKSKTQLVNQRKQKVAFSPGTAHSLEIGRSKYSAGELSSCHRLCRGLSTGLYQPFKLRARIYTGTELYHHCRS